MKDYNYYYYLAQFSKEFRDLNIDRINDLYFSNGLCMVRFCRKYSINMRQDFIAKLYYTRCYV